MNCARFVSFLPMAVRGVISTASDWARGRHGNIAPWPTHDHPISQTCWRPHALRTDGGEIQVADFRHFRAGVADVDRHVAVLVAMEWRLRGARSVAARCGLIARPPNSSRAVGHGAGRAFVEFVCRKSARRTRVPAFAKSATSLSVVLRSLCRSSTNKRQPVQLHMVLGADVHGGAQQWHPNVSSGSRRFYPVDTQPDISRRTALADDIL